MDAMSRLVAVRDLGRATTEECVERIRGQLREDFRRSLGSKGDPPPPCRDPDIAYFAPGCITRELHSDVPSMLIGGLAALLFQMLHPLAMAGVADHSNFRKDPIGRLGRTATFLNATTFGSQTEAEAAIARVRHIHETVMGTAPDGRSYAASDPVLVEWVHATEMHSFLMSWRAFGYRRLAVDEEDRYLDEMARVAIALGAHQVPRNTSDLQSYFEGIRPELALTDQARSARNFILRGVGRWPHEVASYGLLMAAAQSIIPGWARRQLQLMSLPAGDRLMVRPAARALGSAMRWVVSTKPETATTSTPTALTSTASTTAA